MPFNKITGKLLAVPAVGDFFLLNTGPHLAGSPDPVRIFVVRLLAAVALEHFNRNIKPVYFLPGFRYPALVSLTPDISDICRTL